MNASCHTYKDVGSQPKVEEPESEEEEEEDVVEEADPDVLTDTPDISSPQVRVCVYVFVCGGCVYVYVCGCLCVVCACM